MNNTPDMLTIDALFRRMETTDGPDVVMPGWPAMEILLDVFLPVGKVPVRLRTRSLH